MADEPMEHVERPSLPWQTERLTECGKDVAEFRVVLSRQDYDVKVRKQGQQRCAMTTCMTCTSRVRYSPRSWEDDPAAVMSRHCGRSSGFRRGVEQTISFELRALALLVEAHRDEFDQTVASLAAAVPLDQLRFAKSYRSQARHG